MTDKSEKLKMSAATENIKLKNIELSTLKCKRDYLQNKLQKVFDLSKAISTKTVLTRKDEINTQQFQAQFSELSRVRDDYEATVMAMIALDIELNPSNTQSTDILDAFDEKYYQCKIVASSFDKVAQEPVCSQTSKHETIRPALPKLTLFQFDGQIENWPTFYDTFKSLVHNRNFDDIDKYHYLLSCVTGSALNIVRNLPVTAANYSVVWQNLVDKYQDQRSLTGRYLDKMLGFAPLTKDTVVNLTLFIETFDHNMKAIKALGIKELEDYLFCHLALRGLDSHTRKLFEESRDQNTLPTFIELIGFVNKQIKVLEHTFPSSSSGSSSNLNQSSNKARNITADASATSRTRMHSHNQGASNPGAYNNARNPSSKSVLAAVTKNNSVNYKLACTHCSQEHMIYRCEQFRKLPVQERIDRVNALKLCINCLKCNHEAKDCKSTMSCGVCSLPHHYLVHKEYKPSPVGVVDCAPVAGSSDGKQASRSPAQQTLVSSHSVCESILPVDDFHSVNKRTNYGVVLGTACVNVSDVSGQKQCCRAVLDSGAQSSFITAACAQRLGVRRIKCPFTVSGLGGEVVKNYGMITCTIMPRNSDVPVSVDMVVVAKVASEMPNIAFPQNVIDSYDSFDLADPWFHKSSHIDILLGNDVVSDLIKDKPLSVKHEIPSVIETVFGFIVSGKLYSENQTESQNLQLSISCEQALDKTLRNFWEIEELPCKPQVNPLDQLAEDIFVNNHSRDELGRYVVPLPFIPEPPPLGDSYVAAKRRLLNTERKLARTPTLQVAYDDFMKEYKNLDHMELYTGDTPGRYLIPHHSILRPSSTSTPLRVVFDASAKTSTNISLNEILLTGPTLYRDIVSIIVNFRLFEYSLTSDVCKMYRAILVRECDRTYQHILYRSDHEQPIQEYELKTITYGMSCSPFLAMRTMLQLAQDEGERFPSAACVLQEGIYMDDILWSCETFSHACTLQDELINLLKCGGLILKKWSSNKAELLERVPAEHRECPVTFVKDDKDVTIKVLGLRWTPLYDHFYFSVNKTDEVTTKRSVLKILASIFDPVGFISPCTFVAKCIMQDLWKLGMGWDEQLPAEVCGRWLAYISELPLLSELQIERHALLPGQNKCELVAFCDASSRGYAACIYIISSDGNGNVKVRLLISKAKVAPVKPVTIPRLELMGSALLCKLLKYVNKMLTRVHVTKVTALTDSTIVLSWLQTEAYKLQTFVSNRVAQIIEVLPPHSWRHVNSENNMADICSRGASPSQLIQQSQTWLQGPDWLYAPRSEWPVTTVYNKSDTEIPELKSNANTFNLVVNTGDIEENAIEFCERLITQFSSFTKLQRTVARIQRLFRRAKKDQSEEMQAVLTTTELINAHDTIIKVVQNAYFDNEMSNLAKGVDYVPSLKKLSPFLDSRGFLRVGGRLTHADLTYNAKHPLLLPKKSGLTKLLIDHFHKKHLHVGPRTLQNIIIQNYWILSARSIIRSILSKCITCFKNRPTSVQPEMAALPEHRVTPTRVFEHVGVDLGGPFYVKESTRRNAKIGKAYLCLFVCFATKAVHLEVLSSLSADCFLATLDRFVARRSLPSCMYSDCGTNFVASSKHLNEVQNFMRSQQNTDDILNGCSKRQILWKFNPPSAPHMGGLWEAGIKSAKYHLVRAVGEKALTFEELCTVFCKVESIMNSRPLSPLPASDNPNEFNVLTAGHFLVGGNLNSVPEYNLNDISLNRLSRWQYLQNCSQLFWKRWSQEYLNTLQQRAKWFKSPPNLKIGDLVLVKVDQTSSNRWPLARVEKLHPGSDGIVRVVTIRTEKGTYQRPVNKLSPLPYTD